MKWAAIFAAEVVCLPSHHENFGVVVAEALACGRPVLISNKVNIWKDIEAAGAGFVADDTVDGTTANFERWLALTPREYAAMTSRAAECFDKRFRVQGVVDRLLTIIGEHGK